MPPARNITISLSRVILFEGLRSGTILAVCSLAFAVLGLMPTLSWNPEVPLLAAAILFPVAVLSWTGIRAATRSGRIAAAPLAAGLAGAIGGCIGGVAYVVFGKPALNVPFGLLAGSVVGVAVGFLSAWFRRLRVRTAVGSPRTGREGAASTGTETLR